MSYVTTAVCIVFGGFILRYSLADANPDFQYIAGGRTALAIHWFYNRKK